MKYKRKSVLVIFLFNCFFSVFASVEVIETEKDLEKIRNRFVSEAMAPNVNEMAVLRLVETINSDGTWPNINYVDVSRTGFLHRNHLKKLVELARAYKKKGSTLQGYKSVKKAFDKGLNYWLANDFICDNWWHNEIGTPTAIINMLLIMDTDLTQKQIEKMIPIAARANMNGTAGRPCGDRIHVASLLARTSLFKRDTALVKEVILIIEDEMKFYQPEQKNLSKEGKVETKVFVNGSGLQYDLSFHHRLDRVNNTTSYGLNFANYYIEWADLVYDTKYRFSEKAIRLTVDYYLDGICKQMVYGRTYDTGIHNRDISRKHRETFESVDKLERLLKITNYRKDELYTIIKARKGEDFVATSYAKFFWQIEHFVFQRPNFYTSVRMYSRRNRNMEEPYNGEGLTNHFRGDGTNYLSVTGKEYTNLAPVNDWMHIPGATTLILDKMPAAKEIQKNGMTDFVGGVTDGNYGAAVFDFKSPHNPLEAKKSWFFFDNEYICLGTNIKSTTKYPVVTTLNQCYLNGEVSVFVAKEMSDFTGGEQLLSNVAGIYHDNVGYVFPYGQKVRMFTGAASGTWYDINRQTSSSQKVVKENVFKLWLEHGKRPVNGAYAYIVLPATTPKKMKEYSDHPAVQILSNTEKLQAVSHTALGLTYAVCYQSLEFVSNKKEIVVDAPCILMLQSDTLGVLRKLTVADPSRKLKKLHLSIEGKVCTVSESAKCTYNVKENKSYLSITLPQKEMTGSSVSVSFTNTEFNY